MSAKNEKKKKNLKKKIKQWLREAKNRMYLQGWKLTIHWKFDEDCPMAVLCDTAYLYITIYVNLDECLGESDKQMRYYCYHEMAHALICRLAELSRKRYVTGKQLRDENERVATKIGRMLTK